MNVSSIMLLGIKHRAAWLKLESLPGVTKGLVNTDVPQKSIAAIERIVKQQLSVTCCGSLCYCLIMKRL